MIRAPTAVAARSTEARNLGVDNRDAAAGFPFVEVVGGPEAGIARTDDRNVELGVAIERRARHDGFVEHPSARNSGIGSSRRPSEQSLTLRRGACRCLSRAFR